MGIPVVGRRHQRQALTPQAANWHCGGISKRICSASGSGLSSTNRQQWVQTQKLTANHNEHSLGTLFSGGTAPQGSVHAGCVQCVREKLDSCALGQCTVGASQDRGGRTVVTGIGCSGWDQGQAQVRDVGPILPRRSLGILWPQSDLYRDTSWNGWQARPEHRCPCQCQASEVAIEIEGRTSGPGFDQARVPGSASRVPGHRARNTSRRTGRSPLDGLRFRQPDLRYPALLLLASGRPSRRHEVGGFGSAASDASGLKDGLLEWRSQSLYNRPEDFVFASEKLKGRKPLDLSAVLKKKIQPAFKSIGITGVGWHTFRHTVGTILAEMGEHQLTIRDYLRHSNLHVTNKYLQATSKTKRLAHDKLVDGFLPGGLLPKPNLLQ